MAETESHPGSGPDAAAGVILSAIQSALQTVVIDGTRHASDLKRFEKILETNAVRLRLDPTNKIYRAEQESKQAIRDECQQQIKHVSNRVAQELYAVYRQLFSEPFNARSKQELVPPATQRSTTPCNQEQEDLTAHVKILEKQLRRNEEELDRIRLEHRQVIETLQQQLAAQDEEIRMIKELLQASTSAARPQPISEDAMAVGDHTNPKHGTFSPPTEPGLDSCNFSKAIVREHRETLNKVITEITDLKVDVVSYLTEIPDNLQRAVRMVQEDVQSTLQTTAASHLKYLTELVQNIVADFDNRLATLESVAKRLAPSISLNSSDQQPVVRKRSPNSEATDTLPNPLTSKDPRLLRRQSTISSFETKSSTEINPPNCTQQ